MTLQMESRCRICWRDLSRRGRRGGSPIREFFGGPFRARTGDPLIKSQGLLRFLFEGRLRFSERPRQQEVQAYRPSASAS